jgi:16S rRNA (guanine527-N7)-methyltransferase
MLGAMSKLAVPDFVQLDIKTLGLDLGGEVVERLAAYLDLLFEANKKINLTAIKDVDLAWQRLIIDSLTLLAGLENVPAGARLIDIGSGGGLPGVVLALCRGDLDITLLEATGKKVRFLKECINAMGLKQVRAVQDRAETLGQNHAHRERYELAVSRAVGPMSLVLEYSLPLVKLGGRVLAMKGPKVEAELDEAGDALDLLGAGDLQVFDAYPESFDKQLVIVSIVKARPTPSAYPRAPGEPRRKPL